MEVTMALEPGSRPAEIDKLWLEISLRGTQVPLMHTIGDGLRQGDVITLKVYLFNRPTASRIRHSDVMVFKRALAGQFREPCLASTLLG